MRVLARELDLQMLVQVARNAPDNLDVGPRADFPWPPASRHRMRTAHAGSAFDRQQHARVRSCLPRNTPQATFPNRFRRYLVVAHQSITAQQRRRLTFAWFCQTTWCSIQCHPPSDVLRMDANETARAAATLMPIAVGTIVGTCPTAPWFVQSAQTMVTRPRPWQAGLVHRPSTAAISR